jgi:hypothetical protein
MAERKAVFTVCPRGEGKKSFWARIGTCWTNKDGSFTVTLDALPLDGKLVIREEQQRDEQPAPQRQQQRSAPRGSQSDFGDYPAGDNDIPF